MTSVPRVEGGLVEIQTTVLISCVSGTVTRGRGSKNQRFLWTSLMEASQERRDSSSAQLAHHSRKNSGALTATADRRWGNSDIVADTGLSPKRPKGTQPRSGERMMRRGVYCDRWGDQQIRENEEERAKQQPTMIEKKRRLSRAAFVLSVFLYPAWAAAGNATAGSSSSSSVSLLLVLAVL